MLRSSRTCFSFIPFRVLSSRFTTHSGADSRIIVQASVKSLQSKAQGFATTHNLNYLKSGEPIPSLNEVLLLQFTPEKIQYLQYEKKGNKMKEKCSLFCNFDDSTLQNRMEIQSSSKSPLLKALSISPNNNEKGEDLFVFDATPGLGEDSFLMASFSKKVLLVERSPFIHILLEDGLQRAKESNKYLTRNNSEKMILHNDPCDSITILNQYLEYHVSCRPHVVYLDPMHEEKFAKSSALPPLKIQLARKIVGIGHESDSNALFEIAKQVASQRVVFKKPVSAPVDSKATFSISGGRAVRYDVYVTQQN